MMTLDGSTGPEKSIYSIRKGAGTNTDAVLAHGRKLADHLDSHDLLGRWMAHHLAALVSAAQDEATVEQRLEIVDTILRIWTVHQHLPSPPLAEFAAVIAGLERLGTTNPWAFWRLGVPESMDADGNGKSIVSAALELEKLTRETLLRLIWLAARDATERNQDWLRLADQIGPTIETEVTSAVISRPRPLKRTALSPGSNRRTFPA